MNHDEINIIYNIKDKKKVKLFCYNFVERNKNNLKLIIDGKKQDLIDYDEKNYICNEHNEKYSSYCEDCNKIYLLYAMDIKIIIKYYFLIIY